MIRQEVALELNGISKTYRRKHVRSTVIDNLSLSVPAGIVFGLLGPNGSGKSTLLRILAGLIKADEGFVRIFGKLLSPQTRREMGMLIESPSFYPFLSGLEHLEMIARVGDYPFEANKILSKIGIRAEADKPVSTYSLGMKQKLGIGIAMLRQPRVVVLDEPTNGLDPDGILEIRELIKELAYSHGVTVFLTSHFLDEVQRTCDRIGIIKNGKLKAEGEVDKLLGSGERMWFDTDRPSELLAILGLSATIGDGGVYADIDRSEVPNLLEQLGAIGINIYEARRVRPKLEAIFLEQTRNENDDCID